MDDDKLNGEQEIKAEEAKSDETSEATSDKDLAKVIPFDPKAETEEAIDEAQAIISDAVENLKTAFNELKKQLAPVKQSLMEVAGAIKDGVVEAKAKADAEDASADAEAKADDVKADDVKADAEADDVKADAEADNADSVAQSMSDDALTAAREASELIVAGVEKFKERASNMKFDLKEVLTREFEQFADANLKEDDYEIDENGKRVVRVNGKFVQNHANEVVPALLRGAVSSLFSAFLGSSDKADSAKSSDDADNADDVVVETPADSKYRVQFDFSKDLGDAIRSAKVSASDDVSDDDEHTRDVGREVLIEGARVLEEGLNGKKLDGDDIEDRFEKAVKRADADESDKAPEDIEVIDEKHRKILELSRQFEQNMNNNDED